MLGLQSHLSLAGLNQGGQAPHLDHNNLQTPSLGLKSGELIYRLISQIAVSLSSLGSSDQGDRHPFISVHRICEQVSIDMKKASWFPHSLGPCGDHTCFRHRVQAGTAACQSCSSNNSSSANWEVKDPNVCFSSGQNSLCKPKASFLIGKGEFVCLQTPQILNRGFFSPTNLSRTYASQFIPAWKRQLELLYVWA